MSAKAAATTPRKAVGSFYEDALTEAERAAFAAARQVQGVDDEIALLRMRLHEELMAGRREFPVLLKAVDMLAKVAVARFRLAPGSQDQQQATLRRVLADAADLEGGVSG